MRKMTPELKTLFNHHFKNSVFTPRTQMFMFMLWDIFCPKKRDELIKWLEMGTTWRYAYERAKNLKKYEKLDKYKKENKNDN